MAIKIARRELRATTSLAGLLATQGRRDRSRRAAMSRRAGYDARAPVSCVTLRKKTKKYKPR